MRRHTVKAIYKKEMLDLLRDKKTIFMMVLLPVILYPLIMIGSSQLTMFSEQAVAKKEQVVVFDFEMSPDLKVILDGYIQESGKLKQISSENPKDDLEEDKIAAYVEEEKIGGKTHYTIFMKHAKDDSSDAAAALSKVFDQYNNKLVEDKINLAGLDVKTTLEPITSEKIDVSKGEEMAGYFLGMILPMMLIIGVLLGATYPAIDIMAGEKERGTLETLLTMPLTNLELIMGKYLAVATISIITALLNVLGMILSVGYLFISIGAQEGNSVLGTINLSRMILPGFVALIGLILLALIFSAVSMCICSLASSFKEAQNYMSPLTIFGMLPAMVSMLPAIKLTPFTAMLPIANVALLMKGVFTFEYDISSMSIVLLSNLAFVIISIWALTKMYHSESILFDNGRGFSFLEKRSQMIPNRMPSLGDGIAVYAISLLIFLYIGTFLQVKFKLLGVGASQLILLGLALGIVFYTKSPAKKVFRLKTFHWTHVIGGFFLWLGTFIIVNLISHLTLYLFPQNLEVLEELNSVLFADSNIWVTLVVVAVLPAICEEMLFRGYLLSACSAGDRFKRGLIISSLMFGAMHLYAIKLLPTTLLGVAFAYVAYQSGSIFIGMILHFINNALAIFVSYYPEGQLAKVFTWLEAYYSEPNAIQIIMLILVAVGLLGIGIYFLKKKNIK